MLSKDEIRMILEALGRETVAEFDGYAVTKPTFGYSKGPKVGGLQAKLSIMLEAARR